MCRADVLGAADHLREVRAVEGEQREMVDVVDVHGLLGPLADAHHGSPEAKSPRLVGEIDEVVLESIPVARPRRANVHRAAVAKDDVGLHV